MSLLMCLDINIVLKTRRVAQLIAYPPPAISTTINIWLVFQEKKLCRGKRANLPITVSFTPMTPSLNCSGVRMS